MNADELLKEIRVYHEKYWQKVIGEDMAMNPDEYLDGLEGIVIKMLGKTK